MKPNRQTVLSPEERTKRKRYLRATLITCMALLMVGGALHVVMLGSERMADMRELATYDLKEEKSRIRAAGEDIALHAAHEAQGQAVSGYTSGEIERLLTKDQWQELETMVPISAGAFRMGTDDKRADEPDKPLHTVTLPAFRMDKYLVTNAQYARFVAATGHRPPLHWKNGRIPDGEAMRPVTMVSWHDATAYAKWQGKRLPTEAEWEKAARGTDGRRWPWGDKMEAARLNTYYNVGSATNVDAYPAGASPYGVLDMAGNVDEWTASELTPYPGSQAAASVFKAKVAKVTSEQDEKLKVIDMVPTEGNYKILRGGSWKSDPFSTATYHRNFAWAHYASDFYGFRCVADVQQDKGK
ncbi:MAG: formylglycine-generating enzyme family protein [Gallionellaceae bacterium]|jgi:iron(II)-dependent oxidoreductase|nr:formylglycine-generating enzyme family protein [Gallionellaceae bacterium]